MEGKTAVGSEEIPNVKEISTLHNFNSGVLPDQGLQIFLMSGVSVTSASQILESFWNIWCQVSQ